MRNLERSCNVLYRAPVCLDLFLTFPFSFHKAQAEDLFRRGERWLPYGSVGTGPGSLPCQAPAHGGGRHMPTNQAQASLLFDIPSPFQVIAAGTSGRAQVKLMELWADGKKTGRDEWESIR